jgi:tetratricopeptide (TPR) repeat protein
LDLIAQADQAGRSDLPDDDARAAALLAKATALAPHLPDAWGKLAQARASLAQYGDPTQVAALVEGTEDAARRALALDPHQADALGSLAVLSPYYGDWLAAERRMDAVLRVDPRHVPTRDAHAFFLVAVGRSRAGAQERLAYVADNPLHAGHLSRLVFAYWILGRIGDADRVADRAMQLWPQHPGIWLSRLWTLAFTGRAERALLHLNEPRGRPDFPPQLVNTLRTSMTALASRRPADIARAIDLLTADVVASQSGSVNAIMILCALGAIDRAFVVADAYLLERGPLIARITSQVREVTVKDQHRRKTNMLFVPVAAPMHADPKFHRLMDDIGLSQYWRDARVQPDFLSAPRTIPQTTRL